jgi:DNA (cytosine-5)-methyltransferase 1
LSCAQGSLFGRLDRLASVVLFAGLGGSCEGIRQATGTSPLAAVNHCPHAIQLHALNHPETLHMQGDVWDVAPREAVRGRTLDLLWLSPDCTHHSRAKGGMPRETGRRALADVAIPWARDARPRVIMLENVPEWLQWGPLNEDGHPIRERAGEFFRAWCSRLVDLGYQIEWRVLRACDYGAPTSRERVYLIARRDGHPIVWPAPTHGPGASYPWRTAAECVDWSLPWARDLRDRPLCEASMRRVDAGRKACGDRPFLIVYYGTGLCASLDKPLPTVTTHDRFGIVSGQRYRMLHPRELARAMGFPESYQLEGSRAEQVARVGNAVCPPVAEALVRANVGTLR